MQPSPNPFAVNPPAITASTQARTWQNMMMRNWYSLLAPVKKMPTSHADWAFYETNGPNKTKQCSMTTTRASAISGIFGSFRAVSCCFDPGIATMKMAQGLSQQAAQTVYHGISRLCARSCACWHTVWVTNHAGQVYVQCSETQFEPFLQMFLL